MTAVVPSGQSWAELSLGQRTEARELVEDAIDPSLIPAWVQSITGAPPEMDWHEAQARLNTEWAADDAEQAADDDEWRRGRAREDAISSAVAQYGITPESVRSAFGRNLANNVGRKLADDAMAATDAEGIEVPEGTTAEAMWDAEIPEVVHRVAGLWGVGANVIFRAQNKTGKSTAAHNVIRSLVTGEPLFGAYAVTPVQRVVLLDSELPEVTIMQWWRKLGLHSGVTVYALSGVEQSFNILDDRVRSAWADKLRGHDVLVLDCLGPFMKALGLDENREGGHYLAALRMLAHEAGIGEILVVHHMGHAGERSRGDSSIDGWGDDLWSLTAAGDLDRDPNSVRQFAARGRNSAIARQPLQFDPTTRLLSINGDVIERDATENEVAALLWDRVHEGVVKTVRNDRGKVTAENRITKTALTTTVYDHVRADKVARSVVENVFSRLIGPGGTMRIEVDGASKRIDFKDPSAASASSPGNPYRRADGGTVAVVPGTGNPLIVPSDGA